MLPRVLIVGTIPYDPDTSSRAFDSYFHNWDKNNLRQVFSDSRVPLKGHCSSLFQITDAMLLKRHFSRKTKVGNIFYYDDCAEKRTINSKKNKNGIISMLYKAGKNKTSINHLLRKLLWKKKYWNTASFRDWLDGFKPECVFLAFSDDFFINEIALFVSNRYQIPIVCCIGDDYYFNDRKSISPFYHIYRKKYKKIINEIFSHKCSAIYIGDKIKQKYNDYFRINGKTIYLTSSLKRRDFAPVNINNPLITYCGNIRLGRADSLIEIANALGALDKNYRLVIYSSETSKKILKKFKKCQFISFGGSIPYSKVLDTFDNSDLVLIVEGFLEKDVNLTRYSLSTKVADSIASGCNVFAYGSMECGAIEYLKAGKYSCVCDDKTELVRILRDFLTNKTMQYTYYRNSQIALENNHNLKKSNSISEQIFIDLVNEKER